MGRTPLESTLEELAIESATQSWDAVVVGGGSAGLTTALTLAEEGHRVALLDAGGAPFLTHVLNTELRFSRQLADAVRNQTQYAWPLAQSGTFGPSFSCLGGRGLFWNGSSPRYRAEDFRGWPFGLDQVIPHYEWAEQAFRVHLGLGQTRLASAVIEALRNAGLSPVPGPFAADVESVKPGWLSAGVASGLGVFLRLAGGILASGRLRVATNVRATRVMIASGVARGVSAQQRGGVAEREILARCVVLAAGCVESTRLAALSELPDPNRRIGLGLQDHIFYRSFHEAPAIYDPAHPESAAVHVPATSQDAEQWEVHAPGRRLFTLDDGAPWSPGTGDAYWLMVRSFAATEKRDENRVEAREGDLGSATIHFEHSAQDRARMDSMRAGSMRIATALGAVVKEERIAGPGGSYHEAGGLDMGEDAAISVTRPDGEFHHVPGLINVDAAAFPRIGAANPHLTIVAVARRQALALASRLS